MNPNRKCGFCHLLDQPQPNINDLLELLPNPKDHIRCDIADNGNVYESYSMTLNEVVDEMLPKLREATDNCPACIMATLRQKGIPVPIAAGFNFTKESQEIWDAFNVEQKNRIADYSY